MKLQVLILASYKNCKTLIFICIGCNELGHYTNNYYKCKLYIPSISDSGIAESIMFSSCVKLPLLNNSWFKQDKNGQKKKLAKRLKADDTTLQVLKVVE